MINYKLNNVGPEDIGDLLLKVEKSFDLKFDYSELANVTTFGEFCDCITVLTLCLMMWLLALITLMQPDKEVLLIGHNLNTVSDNLESCER